MRSFVKSVLFVSIAAAVMVGCNNKDPEPPKKESDGKAEMLTFGFYAADNSTLSQDYVTEIADEMVVRLPGEVDKSALIARFTAGDDDVVKVNGALQQSGVTAQNYNYPVDFDVTDSLGNVTKSYVVKVGKILENVWAKAGEIAVGNGATYAIRSSYCSMALNPKTQLPYVAFAQKTPVEGSTSTIYKMSVAKFDGKAFQLVGPEHFTGKVSGTSRLAFNAEGTPYLAYIDGDNGTKVTVVKFDGQAWQVVGAAGFTDKAHTSYGIGLEIDPTSQQPVVIYTGNDKTLTASYRTLSICYFDGTSWITGLTAPGRPALNGTDYVATSIRSTAGGGKIYFGCNNLLKTNGNSVYCFSNGTITTVKEGSFIDPASSDTSMQDLGLAVASDGKTLYVLSADDADATIWHPRLFKYTFADSSVAPVNYGTINTVVTRSSAYTVALDANDNLFLGYNENDGSNSGRLVIANIDKESMRWQETVLSEKAINGGSEEIYIRFGSKTGYVMATTDDDNIELYSYGLEPDILPE